MQSPIILFDGVCNLCNTAVKFVLKNDTEKVFKFASLQSAFAQEFLKKNHFPLQSFDTIIFIENDHIFTKSNAVFKIAKHLPKYRWLGLLSFLPMFITDFFYEIISRNRLKWFGQKESCWLPTKELADRFL